MCNKAEGRISCKIVHNKKIADNIYEMIISCKDIVQNAKPGQFVNLYCKSEAMLLPRPISICEVNKNEGSIKLVYAVIGAGTKSLPTLSASDEIDVLGPLGNGYKFNNNPDNVSILIGGGVGTPPLVELAKELVGEKIIYLGFRSTPYLVEELKKYAEVFVATDDGSVGFKGTVTELMNNTNAHGNQIYACGPKPMLKAVKTWAVEHNIPAQLSLEERMGCGFGACVGCVTKIKADNEEGYTYKKVCKDGPVFDAGEVLFE